MTKVSTARLMRPMLAAGLIALMAALWTVVESLPVLLTSRYSLYQIVWMRYATHVLVMAIVLGPRRWPHLVRTSRPGLQVCRGMLMLIMPAAFIGAVGRMPTHDVLAVFWLAPLMILAFAAALTREAPGWRLCVAVAAAVLGAELVLRPDRAALQPSAVLALAMALSFSLYVVLTRSLRDEPRSANLFYTAACVLVPLSALMPTVWHPPSVQDAAVMATIGVVGFALLWSLDRACELAPASAVAAIAPLQVVFGVALALIVGRIAPGGEAPGLRVVAGCAVIAVAVLAGVAALRRPATVRVETASLARE